MFHSEPVRFINPSSLTILPILGEAHRFSPVQLHVRSDIQLKPVISQIPGLTGSTRFLKLVTAITWSKLVITLTHIFLSEDSSSSSSSSSQGHFQTALHNSPATIASSTTTISLHSSKHLFGSSAAVHWDYFLSDDKMDDHISELPDYISEFPDCTLSLILEKLSIKDLVKTSILSKKWCKRWALRRHLYFDIFNVLGRSLKGKPGFHFPVSSDASSDTIRSHVNLFRSRDEFVKRVDQFVKNFPGTKIDSFIVNFCLDYEQNETIDQWISFAIARGVERIDLLFLGRPYAPPSFTTRGERYKLDFALFSETNASNLNHLRLEHCLVYHPTNRDFIQFQNLRSLSLEEVKVDETFIESLLSKCPRLEELCLLSCEFNFKSSMPVIVSSSLCHLKVIGCYIIYMCNDKWPFNLISVDCLKLTSLELGCLELTSSGDGLATSNFNTPMLKSIKISISLRKELNTFVALCATFFPKLEIMHLTTFSMVTTSLQITQPFRHLQQLNLIIFVDSYILDDVKYDPLWILTILQASPLLQKLSVMFGDSEFSKNTKDIRDVERFSHDEVKVIKLGGCVCSPEWFEGGCERMMDKLLGQEVVGREKLVFIDYEGRIGS